MRRHVFTVRLSDDAEGPRVGVRNIGDRVSVQSGLVGNGTDLLNGRLGAGVGAAGKGHLERLVVTERHVSPGAQASGWLLGRRGGILRRGLRDVLIQPLGYKMKPVTICSHLAPARNSPTGEDEFWRKKQDDITAPETKKSLLWLKNYFKIHKGKQNSHVRESFMERRFSSYYGMAKGPTTWRPS